MSSRQAVTLALAGLAFGSMHLSGCATLESDVKPDQYAYAPPVGYLADTDATEDASRLVVSNYDNVYVIDGDTGELVASVGIGFDGQGTGLFEGLEVERETLVTVGGVTYTFDEATSQVLTLPQSNRLIVFDYDDYEAGMERVTAVDLESGETAWHSGDYLYSIQQYEQFVEGATQAAAQALGAMLGGEGQGENSYNRRERQRHFMRHTMASVDDGESILFKTFN